MLRNLKNMAVMCIIFLLIIHFWILLVCFELMTSESLIVLLYSSNIILILIALSRRLFPSEERDLKEETLREIAHNAVAETAYSLSPREPMHRWPNLYIQRWKSKYLAKPVEYPLDRIAYLNAKYTMCTMECCLILKNSELKLLVKKSNLSSHEQILDELHPSKMVNDSFDTYLRRRSAFYMKRNVISGGRTQLTRPGRKLQFRDGQELVVFQYASPYSSVVDLLTKGHPCFDYSPTTEEEDDDKVLTTWKRIRRAFSR